MINRRGLAVMFFVVALSIWLLPDRGANSEALQATAVSTLSATTSSTLAATVAPTSASTSVSTTVATLAATTASTLSATLSVTAPATTPAATMVSTSLATMSPTTAATLAVAPASAQSSYVRAVHASSDAPVVDIYLNGQIVFPKLKYGDKTDFTKIAPGSYTIDVRPASAAVTTKPMYTTDIVLVPGISADLVALGTPDAAGTQAFQLAVFVTDRGPTKGQARIEFINAATNAGTIDVLQGNKAVLTQIKFGKMANAPLNLAPDTYNFALVPTGKTTPVVADLKGTQLQADMIYTVIAVKPTGQQTAPTITLTTTSLDKAQMQPTQTR